MDTKYIKAFARFLSQTTDLLRRVHRWSHYDQIPENERETVETHSLISVWLASAMLAIERHEKTHKLNEARILLAAALHDVGEGRMGDIGYAIKNDPRIKELLEAIEREYVADFFNGFPPIIRFAFIDAYAVENESSLDGKFFKAVERVGYILYAVPQVKRGRDQFLQVFVRQHEALVDLSEQFESVRRFYAPYRDYVAEKLADLAARNEDDDD
ncbi:HD domain-containing protein [Patescibacteria group bacterium]|nr:HD domain-containing protein [Patescibacteria group bacterium]MBU1448973.1 HD domain-containing protein [Patescibacteria group bacterium]MBU2612915.1 HD domain-containing protein [Patescibacteria group bacterium]